jgi:hypothetical protein
MDSKKFEEFVQLGIVKKQNPNKSRAKFLIVESEKDYTYLLKLIKTMGIDNDNANSIIKLCYDIIMELVRAKMLLGGLNAFGLKAHEAEVSYVGVLGFAQADIVFLDQMRFFRNGMLYYGTMLDEEYAEKVVEFTRKIYSKLRKILEN